jgi:uncharacterized damage-inducible protein DinB
MLKQHILSQFTRCFDENGWFVALGNAIKDVTVEQAAWKPADSVNCIWETLSHVTYYNHAYLQRFKGIAYEYDVTDNDQTFSTGEYTESEWQADVARFNEVMTQFRSLIEASDESKFAEPVPAKTERKWAELLADINAHNAHHAGQIDLLRKLQGTWDNGKGVS